MKTSQTEVIREGELGLGGASGPADQASGFKWRSLGVWTLILAPLSVLTSDWMLFHAIILFSVGPSLIGASMTKRFAFLWPFTIALCLALSIAVFGHSILEELGVTGFLPKLLGQGVSK